MWVSMVLPRQYKLELNMWKRRHTWSSPLFQRCWHYGEVEGEWEKYYMWPRGRSARAGASLGALRKSVGPYVIIYAEQLQTVDNL